jgi:hypothetical protein
MNNFILHDILIQDTKTKKIYTFNPNEWTVMEMNNELKELNESEVSDIENCNELNTSYIYKGAV